MMLHSPRPSAHTATTTCPPSDASSTHRPAPLRSLPSPPTQTHAYMVQDAACEALARLSPANLYEPSGLAQALQIQSLGFSKVHGCGLRVTVCVKKSCPRKVPTPDVSPVRLTSSRWKGSEPLPFTAATWQSPALPMNPRSLAGSVFLAGTVSHMDEQVLKMHVQHSRAPRHYGLARTTSENKRCALQKSTQLCDGHVSRCTMRRSPRNSVSAKVVHALLFSKFCCARMQ